MSFEPRSFPAGRRSLAEGRVRVAVLVAGAYLLGAAGGGVPALAGDPPSSAAVAACQDPARTTQTVVVDGQEVDCADPASPAQTTPADTTPPEKKPAEPPAPPADKPKASPSGSDPAAGTPAAEDPKSQAPTIPGSEFPAPTPSPKTPAAAKAQDKPKSEAERPAAQDAPKERARAGASGKTKGETKAGSDATTTVKGRPAARARARGEAKARGDAEKRSRRGSGGDAAAYAALPASWTSLTPLTLPVSSVDGFPIPPFLLPIYQAAAAQYGVPWEVLASINEIETNFGRNAGVSSAGALGWMQFIYSSWERWGTDGDGDGRRDPRNPVDAIFAAARYLDDAGAGTDLPKAIFAYNHADWYVNDIVERAREFAGLDPTLVAALSDRALRENTFLYRAHGNPFAGPGAIKPTAGQALLLTKKQLTRMVLRGDAIKIYPGGRQDIAAGRINRRVLATLVFLTRSGLKPTVSSLTTGHGLRTASGNISAHSYGHAADISAVNGVVIAGNQGSGSITAKTLKKLVQLQGYERPNQVISLMTIDGQDNTLSMSDHADHIHVGFPRIPQAPAAARPSDIQKLVATLRARPTSGK